ncbi:hypothetical protein AERO9A_330086 [Aeromonas salmonicida]|nr:hypothetical protein AERO9A_330086 [Aeromonas salmonicida]
MVGVVGSNPIKPTTPLQKEVALRTLRP